MRYKKVSFSILFLIAVNCLSAQDLQVRDTTLSGDNKFESYFNTQVGPNVTVVSKSNTTFRSRQNIYFVGQTHIESGSVVHAVYDPAIVNSINTKQEKLPNKITLEQNYPNPFNPITTVRFNLNTQQNLKLTIHNALGQLVKILYSGPKNAGPHSFNWDGTNNKGQNVGSGIYFYRLTTDKVTLNKKMMLIK